MADLTLAEINEQYTAQKQQVQQAQEQITQQQQQVQAFNPQIYQTQAQLLKATPYSQVNVQALEAQRSEAKNQALTELGSYQSQVNDYSKQVQDYEKQVQEYMASPAGIVQYSQESGIKPEVRYENVSAATGSKAAGTYTYVEKKVPIYTYTTPYGTFTDTSQLEATKKNINYQLGSEYSSNVSTLLEQQTGIKPPTQDFIKSGGDVSGYYSGQIDILNKDLQKVQTGLVSIQDFKSAHPGFALDETAIKSNLDFARSFQGEEGSGKAITYDVATGTYTLKPFTIEPIVDVKKGSNFLSGVVETAGSYGKYLNEPMTLAQKGLEWGANKLNIPLTQEVTLKQSLPYQTRGTSMINPETRGLYAPSTESKVQTTTLTGTAVSLAPGLLYAVPILGEGLMVGGTLSGTTKALTATTAEERTAGIFEAGINLAFLGAGILKDIPRAKFGGLTEAEVRELQTLSTKQPSSRFYELKVKAERGFEKQIDDGMLGNPKALENSRVFREAILPPVRTISTKTLWPSAAKEFGPTIRITDIPRFEKVLGAGQAKALSQLNLPGGVSGLYGKSPEFGLVQQIKPDVFVGIGERQIGKKQITEIANRLGVTREEAYSYIRESQVRKGEYQLVAPTKLEITRLDVTSPNLEPSIEDITLPQLKYAPEFGIRSNIIKTTAFEQSLKVGNKVQARGIRFQEGAGGKLISPVAYTRTGNKLAQFDIFKFNVRKGVSKVDIPGMAGSPIVVEFKPFVRYSGRQVAKVFKSETLPFKYTTPEGITVEMPLTKDLLVRRSLAKYASVPVKEARMSATDFLSFRDIESMKKITVPKTSTRLLKEEIKDVFVGGKEVAVLDKSFAVTNYLKSFEIKAGTKQKFINIGKSERYVGEPVNLPPPPRTVGGFPPADRSLEIYSTGTGEVLTKQTVKSEKVITEQVAKVAQTVKPQIDLKSPRVSTIVRQEPSIYAGTGMYERTTGGLVMGQMMQLRQVQVQQLKLQQGQQLKLESMLILKPQVSMIQQQILQEKIIEKQQLGQKLQLNQIQIQVQQLKQLQQLQQKQQTQVQTHTTPITSITRITPERIEIPNIIKPKIPTIVIPFKKDLSRRLLQKAPSKYTVYGRRYGKFKPIATSSDVGQAVESGKKFAKSTLGASFRVKGPKGFVGLSSSPEFRYGKAGRDVTTLTQKANQRIKSFGEKAEIKRSRNRGKVKLW